MLNIRKILQNEKGESITETLVSTLIASLALVLLAGMLTSSVNVIKKSKTAMSSYYESLNQMVRMEEPVSMTVIVTNEAGNSVDVDVNGYFSDENAGKSVVLYAKETE